MDSSSVSQSLAHSQPLNIKESNHQLGRSQSLERLNTIFELPDYDSFDNDNHSTDDRVTVARNQEEISRSSQVKSRGIYYAFL